MNKICDKDKCCGCHACINICPKNAITMETDIGGFKYPVIDQSKCIKCGMCKKVCPVLINKVNSKKDIISYACFNKNLSERLNSSSGGIFVLLAKQIIKRKGVVFGASFDQNFEVRHSWIETENDLNQFMGSKYTQSTIGNTYKKARDILDKGKYVLFSGTPCQIEGLKSYLRKDYDKLITQDIICHGVPSPKLWKKYIEYQKEKHGENIKSISFRNKDNGWSSYQMKILFETKKYNKNLKNDIYLRAFLSNVCLRKSCYNCSFKEKYRNSDITLADYWGIDNVHNNINDDKGVSLVIINTEKGKILFESIKEFINCYETNVNNALKYNSSMTKSAKPNNKREEFLNQIDNLSIDKLVEKYAPKPNIIKRIIIVLKKCIKFCLKQLLKLKKI